MFCELCKKEYSSNNINRKYCSLECFHKSRIGKTAWNRGINAYFKGGSCEPVKDNAICLNCGKSFHIKQSQIDKGKGKYCSRVCYMKDRSKWMKDKSFNPAYKVDFAGKNNPNWRGGTSFEPYALGWNLTHKEQIRSRDSYKCQVCSLPEIEHGRRLAVHHIDYDKLNINPNNLVTLCNRCHSRTNFNRDYWKSFFLKGVMPNAHAF